MTNRRTRARTQKLKHNMIWIPIRRVHVANPESFHSISVLTPQPNSERPIPSSSPVTIEHCVRVTNTCMAAHHFRIATTRRHHLSRRLRDGVPLFRIVARFRQVIFGGERSEGSVWAEDGADVIEHGFQRSGAEPGFGLAHGFGLAVGERVLDSSCLVGVWGDGEETKDG